MQIGELAIPLEQPGDTNFESLLASHERQVARTAYRLLGDPDEAREATQEVFLRLYRNMGRMREDSNLPAWLYRVTVNVCRDLLKRRPPFVGIDRDYASNQPDPESTSTFDQHKRLLAWGLGKLTPQQRECVTLHDIEGLPASEVAAIAGCSEATVRSHLSHGRARLRDLIERRSS